MQHPFFLDFSREIMYNVTENFERKVRKRKGKTMTERLARLFKDFEFDGTEELSVTEINGVELPKDYLRFMAENGGGEGALGEVGYLQLWRLSELAENNELYEAAEVLPNCALIASDLSGALFGVTRQGEYFAADLGAIIREDEIEIMCCSFEEFIVKAANGDYF